MRSTGARIAVAFCVLSFALPVLAQAPTTKPEPGHFKNLKVLPQDISDQELRAMMSGVTRALGVRCEYCHVHEGKTFTPEDFPKDGKVTKDKARDMIRMVRDINEKYLAALDSRKSPPITVGCVTCHHGTPEPRTLQSVLQMTYDAGGLDSTVSKYRTLRERSYGRFTYDFGDVPLADVGSALAAAGHAADAESLLALNVAMNPNSGFAKRQLATASVVSGFLRGPAEGARALEAVRARSGAESFNEEMLNVVGYQLLAQHQMAAAIAAFQENVKEHPESGNAYDSLGEAYVVSGDKKKARAAYEKALKLDPKNDNAKHQLETLKK